MRWGSNRFDYLMAQQLLDDRGEGVRIDLGERLGERLRREIIALQRPRDHVGLGMIEVDRRVGYRQSAVGVFADQPRPGRAYAVDTRVVAFGQMETTTDSPKESRSGVP